MPDAPERPEHDANAKAEAALRTLLATVEEARNHLMDARAGDKEGLDESLDAIDDLLAQAAMQAESSQTEEHRVSLDAKLLREANHAIRGALGATIGHLDLLRMDENGPRARDAWMGARLAERYVQEFFETARASIEGPIMPLRPVSIVALVEEVTDVAQAHADQRDVRLSVRVDDNCKRGRVDPDGIQAILELMIDHAVEAAGPDTTVSVRLRRHQGGIRVEARHRGSCGWTPEQHFKPFEPAEPEAPAGLMALQVLARLRAGTVGVEPVEPRGERIWVHLPDWENAPATAPSEERRHEPVEAGEGPRILVVEDEREDRDSLQIMLGEAGYQVTAVSSVQQAVAAVEKQRFDAITLDLLLGRSYSTRVLAAARSGRNDRAAIIVLSATRPGNVAFPFPVQAHLQKPLSKRTLLRALRWSGVAPPRHGPVMLISRRDAPEGLEAGLRRRHQPFLHVPDEATALQDMDEDPAVVIVDGHEPASDTLLEALDGCPLIVWGKGPHAFRSVATAVLEEDSPASLFLEEIDRIAAEQSIPAEGGSF